MSAASELGMLNAESYAGVGGTYSFTAIQCSQPLSDLFPRAKNAFLKALELDESSVRAHAELGMLMLLDWNWSAAENEYQRALSLNPNHAAALFSYGIYLIIMGRYDEAVSVTKRALEQDPFIPTRNLQLGWVLYYARRNDESIVQLKKTLEMAPNLGWPNMQLAWNFGQKRMYPEAIAECRRAIELCPEDQVVLAGCEFVYGLAGKRAEALKCLANWRDDLRSDPRFQNLLRRMNFPLVVGGNPDSAFWTPD